MTNALSRSTRLLTRSAALFALAVGGLWAVRLASAQAAIPRSVADWRAWARSTDISGALIPLLCAALIALVAFLCVTGVGYASLRALGCARAAASFGWLVVPAVRRRVDRTVAIGVLASLMTVVGTGLPSVARAADPDLGGVVRDPEPVIAVADPPATPDASRAATGSGSIADAVREPEVATPQSDATAPASVPMVTRTNDDFVPDALVATSGSSDDDESVGFGDVSGEVGDSALEQGATSSAGSAPDAVRTPAPDSVGSTQASSAVVPAPSVTGAPSAPIAVAQYAVANGDNLWEIATKRLAQVRGVEAATLSVHEVAVYWVQVVEANRSTLRSGNPSLIYAGERITLPAVA